MAVNLTHLKAQYQAQSDLNTDGIAAFVNTYPMFATLPTPVPFTDTYGLNWQAEYIYATTNEVFVHCRWINDDDEVTDKFSTYDALMFGKAKFTYSYDTVLADEPAGTKYTIPELQNGELLEVTIEGLPVSYTFDPDVNMNNITIDPPTTSGQNLFILYKNNPTFYSY